MMGHQETGFICVNIMYLVTLVVVKVLTLESEKL